MSPVRVRCDCRALRTQWVAAAQLWLLGILALELVPDAVQQPDVALLRVFLQRGNEGPGHGARRLTGDLGVLGCLVVFAAGPHDDVRGGRLGDFVLLVDLVPCGGFLEEAHGRRSNPTNVSPSVLRHDRKQTLAGLLGQVGLLENTLGRVYVWKIECRARVTGVKDCGKAYAWHEGLHQDAVHFVVDDVAGHSKVDRVYNFVITIIFVAVEIRCLPTMTCNRQYLSLWVGAQYFLT